PFCSHLVDFYDPLGLLCIRNELAFFIFGISKTTLQILNGNPLFIFSLIYHLRSDTAALALCLCKGRQNGEHQLSLRRQGIDVLKFKKNTDIEFLKLSGSL